MHTIHTHVNRPPHAIVQIGPYQIAVELPGGLRVGDPEHTPAIAKSIAAGLESAFETQPPRADV